jgi:nitroreductase
MILDLLRRRASVRTYRDTPIPQGVIDEMIEAARLSPSGGNEQPWRFGFVSDRHRLRAVAEACHGQAWIASAPLVVALCTVIVPDERGGRDIQMRRFPAHASAIAKMPLDLYAALTLEEHQTKIAGAHMALAALEHGVGSTWISLFDVARVAQVLQLPAGVIPSEMLAFGYPASAAVQRPKKPAAEVLFFDVFGGQDAAPGNAG